jgi:hypothetical protein
MKIDELKEHLRLHSLWVKENKEGYTEEQIRKYGKFIEGCANILKEEK